MSSRSRGLLLLIRALTTKTARLAGEGRPVQERPAWEEWPVAL